MADESDKFSNNNRKTYVKIPDPYESLYKSFENILSKPVSKKPQPANPQHQEPTAGSSGTGRFSSQTSQSVEMGNRKVKFCLQDVLPPNWRYANPEDEEKYQLFPFLKEDDNNKVCRVAGLIQLVGLDYFMEVFPDTPGNLIAKAFAILTMDTPNKGI